MIQFISGKFSDHNPIGSDLVVVAERRFCEFELLKQTLCNDKIIPIQIGIYDQKGSAK